MFLLAFFLSPFATVYEARAPQLVVKAFVEAIQKEDLAYLEKYVDLEAIANQTRHGYNLGTLKKLFQDVKVNQIQFSNPVVDSKTQIIRINMTQPLSFTFELQHQNATVGKGDFYRIIGINP